MYRQGLRSCQVAALVSSRPQSLASCVNLSTYQAVIACIPCLLPHKQRRRAAQDCLKSAASVTLTLGRRVMGHQAERQDSERKRHPAVGIAAEWGAIYKNQHAWGHMYVTLPKPWWQATMLLLTAGVQTARDARPMGGAVESFGLPKDGFSLCHPRDWSFTWAALRQYASNA